MCKIYHDKPSAYRKAEGEFKPSKHQRRAVLKPYKRENNKNFFNNEED